MAAVVATAAAAGCAPNLPQQPTERALVRDVARVVQIRSDVGWFIDEHELEQVMPDLMKSACRVDDLHRAESLKWLDEEIGRLGGPVDAAWRQRGKQLDEVDDLLRMTRVRLALQRADGWVRAGRCPFWVEPRAEFEGWHFNGRRLMVTLEGSGHGTEEFLSNGDVHYGGGGSGRLLLGRGLSDSMSLYFGLEAGGEARVSNLQLGDMQQVPALFGFFDMPVGLRIQLGLSTFMELEGGPHVAIDQFSVEQSTGDVTRHYRVGARGGLAFGASYLRLLRGVMPRVTLFMAFVYLPAAGQQEASPLLMFGGRTGIDWSRIK